MLIIDDDKRILSLLGEYLSQNEFIISKAKNSTEARCLLNYFQFDILIIDIMMPGENGLDLLKDIRRTMKIPAIFLSAKGEPKDKISGLEIGADDYLAKPFEPQELLLRLQRLLDRSAAELNKKGNRKIDIGSKIFDLDRLELYEDKNLIKLTNNEANLLNIFVSSPLEIISREKVMNTLKLNTEAIENNERNVDVQITRLRKKLELDPKNPKYLKTIRGKGYQFLP